VPVAEDIGLYYHRFADYALGGMTTAIDLRGHGLDHDPALGGGDLRHESRI
jgi:hypothetical protein